MSSASDVPNASDSSHGNILRLRDGRALSYLEVGAPDGTPVIHCHGNPSSRLEVLLLAEQATSLKVRLIGLDRPGIGYSDPKPGYGLLDWPDDVAELADRLGLDRFAMSGLSGGGPFALACAYKMPERLTACGLISTVTPVAFMKQVGPWSVRVVYALLEYMPPACSAPSCDAPCRKARGRASRVWRRRSFRIARDSAAVIRKRLLTHTSGRSTREQRSEAIARGSPAWRRMWRRRGCWPPRGRSAPTT